MVCFDNVTGICATFALLFCLLHYAQTSSLYFSNPRLLSSDSTGGAICPQQSSLVPIKHAKLWKGLIQELHTTTYIDMTAQWLSGAVRIPTEVFDEMGPIDEDVRWEKFAHLDKYLLQSFPRTHDKLDHTRVNTYGSIYRWIGTDPSLKPLLLTAHQDVVPVDPATHANWTHPPYSGHYDGSRIWGRGSADDKNVLISILAAVETLLKCGFEPTRSVVLGFGFDEEATGLQGAYQIGQYLLETYGENSFAMLVDEGDPVQNIYGAPFALPAVSEKGYFDLLIEVSSPGGHSSLPPEHTAIGVLSRLVVAYESSAPPARLERSSHAYTHAQCLAAYAPKLPSHMRRDILHSRHSDAALQRAEKALFANDPGFAALGRTTQAVDMIWGGVKSNTLPEGAAAVVNHRISPDSTVKKLKNHAVSVLEPIAKKLNLSLSAFPEDMSPESISPLLSDIRRRSKGQVTLRDAWDTALEPAPVSPSNSQQWRVLAGTIRAAWDARPRQWASHTEEGTPGPGLVIVPSLLGGNTDTQFYWKLTPHIYRYNHYYAADGPADGNIHTVDEACEAKALVGMVQFFVGLILNVDEATWM